MSIMGNVAGLGALQADWAQTDERRADFIRNKPDFSGLEGTLEELEAVAEGALPKGGGQMTGAIAMGGNRVTGLGLPLADGDAATKGYVKGYIDGMRLTGTVTLYASEWTGSGPFTQSVAMGGITAEDCPHYGVVYSGTNGEKIGQREAFSCIDDLETGEGILTFICFDSEPDTDIMVQIECLLHSSAAGEQVMAVLTMEEGSSAPVQAFVDGRNYDVSNAVLNGTPTEKTFDFTVL